VDDLHTMPIDEARIELSVTWESAAWIALGGNSCERPRAKDGVSPLAVRFSSKRIDSSRKAKRRLLIHRRRTACPRSNDRPFGYPSPVG
jgi:hypothetical protein